MTIRAVCIGIIAIWVCWCSLKSPVLVQSLVNYRNVIWKGGDMVSVYFQWVDV